MGAGFPKDRPECAKEPDDRLPVEEDPVIDEDGCGLRKSELAAEGLLRLGVDRVEYGGVHPVRDQVDAGAG